MEDVRSNTQDTWDSIVNSRQKGLEKLWAGAMAEFLRNLGFNLEYDGLKDTPVRMTKWINTFLNPEVPKITTFENTGDYDQMVVVRDIPIYSLCEHHFLPFFGTCDVAYIPGKKILGLSKIPRIAKYIASGPQTQEYLTETLKKVLQELLLSKDVMVRVQARHLCMEMRGIEMPGTNTVTVGLGGEFEKPEVRAEFYSLLK